MAESGFKRVWEGSAVCFAWLKLRTVSGVSHDQGLLAEAQHTGVVGFPLQSLPYLMFAVPDPKP